MLRVLFIFDWYEEDFEDSVGSFVDYLLCYVDVFVLLVGVCWDLEVGDLLICFLDYDWFLNIDSNNF